MREITIWRCCKKPIFCEKIMASPNEKRLYCLQHYKQYIHTKDIVFSVVEERKEVGKQGKNRL